MKTIATAIAGALALAALNGCGRDQAPSAPPSNASAATSAAASSAEASASAAEASAALARANVPAPRQIQESPPPSVNIAEEAQAAGDEAPQELRNKVNAAKDAGRAPTR
jgi:hypothetical protein